MSAHSTHRGLKLNYEDLEMMVTAHLDSIRKVFHQHGLSLNEYMNIEIIEKTARVSKQKSKYLSIKTYGMYKEHRFGVFITFHGIIEDEIKIWVKITNKKNVFVYNYYKKIAYPSIGYVFNIFRMENLRGYLNKWVS